MKKVVDDIRLMTKISDMYYNQGINKQDIAKQLQISRPIVIRMLKSAQDLGIVDIHIRNLDLIHHWDLENELQKKFELSDKRSSELENQIEEIRKATVSVLEEVKEQLNSAEKRISDLRTEQGYE